MPVYINALCNTPGCRHLQPMSFDLLSETWADMLKSLVDAGWTIELEGAVPVSMYCPAHKPPCAATEGDTG
jgi:hypothetical protein